MKKIRNAERTLIRVTVTVSMFFINMLGLAFIGVIPEAYAGVENLTILMLLEVILILPFAMWISDKIIAMFEENASEDAEYYKNSNLVAGIEKVNAELKRELTVTREFNKEIAEYYAHKVKPAAQAETGQAPSGLAADSESLKKLEENGYFKRHKSISDVEGLRFRDLPEGTGFEIPEDIPAGDILKILGVTQPEPLKSMHIRDIIKGILNITGADPRKATTEEIHRLTELVDEYHRRVPSTFIDKPNHIRIMEEVDKFSVKALSAEEPTVSTAGDDYSDTERDIDNTVDKFIDEELGYTDGNT